MNTSALPCLSFIALAATLAWAPSAEAQVCDFPLCAAGSNYNGGGTDSAGPYGSCKSCNWWGFCSHTLNRCPTGSTLNLTTGNCTHNLCSGGCGGELPLCDADERYTGSGVDAEGVYGVCQHGPSGPGGYLSHQLKHCRVGWRLQTASGQCFKECLPDLTLRRSFLRNASGSVVFVVPAYRPYFICVEVTNVGMASSVGFQVGGGGLGVAVAPVTSVVGLSPGATVVSCLRYTTTPSPGSYRVGVSADSTGFVSEANETNNGLIVPVTVVP